MVVSIRCEDVRGLELYARVSYKLGSVILFALGKLSDVVIYSHFIMCCETFKVFNIIINEFMSFVVIGGIEVFVRVIHESALGKPTMIKKESNATISQHLCLIIYGKARALPAKYNLEPIVVSIYNVMKYATHKINDEQMRVWFSMNWGNQGDE